MTGRETLLAYGAYFEGSKRPSASRSLAAAVQPVALLPIPWLAKRAFDRLIPAGDVPGLLGRAGRFSRSRSRRPASPSGPAAFRSM